MKHIFIMNPVAGTRLARRMKRQIAKTCRRLRVDYHTHYTRSADDAPQYVRKLLDTHPEETYRIYAVGGDGTVSDLSGVVYGRENAELAVIPIGTGNDFTRNFGSPKEFCDIEDYINGSAIEVDAIRYNDSVSINVTNMGFDCEVVDMMERNRSKPLMNNSFSYTICVFMVLARMPKGHVRFVMEDGSVRESRFLLSLFGNGAYYGGGYKAASKAALGKLYFCVVNAQAFKRGYGLIYLLQLICIIHGLNAHIRKNIGKHFAHGGRRHLAAGYVYARAVSRRI